MISNHFGAAIDKRGGIIDNPAEIAEVAELADAQDSKSCPGNRVWVQVPPSALFVARTRSYLDKDFHFRPP